MISQFLLNFLNQDLRYAELKKQWNRFDINENQWNLLEINPSQWKTMRSIANHRSSMKRIEIHWKSFWKSFEITMETFSFSNGSQGNPWWIYWKSFWESFCESLPPSPPQPPIMLAWPYGYLIAYWYIDVVEPGNL